MRGAKASDPQVAPVDRSPSLHKISPLQQYILEQAKLSGYRLRRWSYSNKLSNTGLLRFGDKVLAEKRDSFIDSENESHRTGSCIQQKFPKENSWKTYLYMADNATFPGDDSDAFADDEAPSSDGMEERDDISLVSTVSSVRTNLFFFSRLCLIFPFQGGRGRQLFVGANVQQPRPPLGKAAWLWTRWQDESECQIGQLFGNSSLFANTRQ